MQAIQPIPLCSWSTYPNKFFKMEVGCNEDGYFSYKKLIKIDFFYDSDLENPIGNIVTSGTVPIQTLKPFYQNVEHPKVQNSKKCTQSRSPAFNLLSALLQECYTKYELEGNALLHSSENSFVTHFLNFLYKEKHSSTLYFPHKRCTTSPNLLPELIIQVVLPETMKRIDNIQIRIVDHTLEKQNAKNQSWFDLKIDNEFFRNVDRIFSNGSSINIGNPSFGSKDCEPQDDDTAFTSVFYPARKICSYLYKAISHNDRLLEYCAERRVSDKYLPKTTDNKTYYFDSLCKIKLDLFFGLFGDYGQDKNVNASNGRISFKIEKVKFIRDGAISQSAYSLCFCLEEGGDSVEDAKCAPMERFILMHFKYHSSSE